MKRFFVAAKQLAVLAGVTAIGASAYQGDAPAPSRASHIRHAPVQVHRNDDGSLARGRNLAVETGNWAGYAVANFETHVTYTAAEATWTVPTVSFTSGAQYSSTWVGIGGFCANTRCTRGDHTLIQLGTEQDVAADGTTTYFSWYELLPAFPVEMGAVAPGDVITASLRCVFLCASKRGQLWELTMSNQAGVLWSVVVPYASSRLSADWIEEAPSGPGGILPLADFGTVTIDPDLASEATPSLSLATNGIFMVDPAGQTATPSDPDSLGFNVCWGPGPGLVACSPP